jgi:hypothetical protein
MKNPFARKPKTDAAETPKGFARHGRIRVQSKGGAIGGLVVKGLAAVLGGTIAVAGISVWDISNTIRANGIELKGPKITAADLDGPINMLLIGSDSREGQDKKIFGNDTSVLADVQILLHISADRKNAVALSFPRDLLVPAQAPRVALATCHRVSARSTRPSRTAGQDVHCSPSSSSPASRFHTWQPSTSRELSRCLTQSVVSTYALPARFTTSTPS